MNVYIKVHVEENALVGGVAALRWIAKKTEYIVHLYTPWYTYII